MATVDDALRRRIMSCQGLVKAIAIRVHSGAPRSVELDDLIGYGEVGLAEAARDFDSQRGIQFSTYAYYRIRGAIYDGLAKMTYHSRRQRQWVVFERNATDILELDAPAAGEGEPSLEDDYGKVRGVTERLFVAYLASHSPPSSEDETDALIEDPNAPPPSVVAARRENCRLLREVVHRLPPDAHELIQRLYFDGQNLTEASEKLGISKSWASRLHARTLERLAAMLRQMGVEE